MEWALISGFCSMVADGCHSIFYENNAKLLLRKCNFIFYFKFKPISNMRIKRKFNQSQKKVGTVFENEIKIRIQIVNAKLKYIWTDSQNQFQT